jgi:hypothetical protein
MNTDFRFNDNGRNNEQGAALITILLVGTLLMVVGGSLALTTGMTAQTTMESTGETQAYYAAEAGIQQALNVLRRGDGGDPISFSTALTDPDLSTWLASTSLANNTSFAINLTNYGLNGTTRTVRLTSTGTGPRGERKVIEVDISRNEAPADEGEYTALVIANTATNADASVEFGSSNAFTITGMDMQQDGDPNYDAALELDLPAIGVQDHDADAVLDALGSRADQVTGSPADIGVMGTSSGLSGTAPISTPSWLANAEATRTFLSEARSKAGSRVYDIDAGESPTGYGTPSNPKITFIDGDITINPSSMSGDGGTGSGLLIVTGDLTLHGNINFNGIIMVLGSGRLIRTGGGGGTINGGIVVAKFDDTGDFLTPTTETSGAGNSTIQRNSAWQRTAMSLVETAKEVQIIGVSEQ